MNSISDTSSQGLTANRSDLQDTNFSAHSKKLSVNAYERLDTGLTIQTREGDVVNMSSSSFSQFNAFEYNSQGQIQTDSGYALINQHTREITLTTGESFSFSVQGDLNEQELADIEAIVKGIDGIVSEVAQGDMDEAVAKAMSMGTYSSVSMYSAEISHESYYAVTEETRSVSRGTLPDTAVEAPDARISNTPKQMAHVVDKMAKFLEKQEDKMLSKAQSSLAALFEQLLKNREDSDKQKTPAYEALEIAGEQLDQIINDRLRKAFETTLDGFV